MKKEETVDYNIKIAWHAISRMYNTEGEPFDISASTGYVLLNIDSENGTPATKIAPLLGLETRSLTRILKTLEEKGWIFRKTDKKDKRFVKIFLTDLGKQKREISRRTVRAYNFFIRENIPLEKLKIFFEVIAEINQLTEEHQLKGQLTP
ncbi:MAG: MarR family transcriptional regulator [Verrucomicrobia bacterium]|nr:MarR family transcriptional regulator [Cytophagales bacterium]